MIKSIYDVDLITSLAFCHVTPGGDSNIFDRDVWSQVSITYPLWCKLTSWKLTHIGEIAHGISATLS